jgi:shikimate dehydrogenase
MYHFGLIGYPLEHSYSPRIQHTMLRIANISGEYRLYPASPEGDGLDRIAGLLQQMRHASLDGLNVTIPHKQTIIPLLDELTGTAQAIGAVNTIYLSQDVLVGDNTDAPGFLTDVEHFLPAEISGKANRIALVLGAGGAARAVVYALMGVGWQVFIAARNPKKASSLVERLLAREPFSKSSGALDAQLCEIDLRHLDHLMSVTPIDLVVNATPVGMAPHVQASPWPDGLDLPPACLVYDLVYNPGETLWMSQARQRGHLARNGWGMLVAQARLAFEKWTGVNVPLDHLMESLSLEG